MRTFEFSDAKSHKFWSIDVSGNSFTVTYGKIGTAGQTQTKSFPTAEKAQAEADKLVKEKTGKGYKETTPKATTSESEALEKAIVANPQDLAAWSAYADLLLEQGDPRGDFMRVQLALEDDKLGKKERDALKKQEAALLKKHEKEWLGDLAAFATGTASSVKYTFARGWLADLYFDNLKVNEARALANCSSAKLLQKLNVKGVEYEAPFGSKESYIDSYYTPGPDVPDGTDSSVAGLMALCRVPCLASVRSLMLGESDIDDKGNEEEYANCHFDGEAAYHLIKQMPQIEEMRLFAHRVDAKKIFALPMPNLRIVQLYHSLKYPLDVLATNKSIKQLTHLLCHPHALDFDDEEAGAYIRLAHIKAICKANWPNFTHLRLRLTDFGDKGAKEIAESGILKRLKLLDLQGGCITDAGAELLANCPDLKKVAVVNLSRNAMTEVGTKAIQKVVPKANVTQQHSEVGGPDGETAEYLMEGDIE